MSENIGAVAQEMMNTAIKYSEDKSQLYPPDTVLKARARGECSVCAYLYYGLARELAEYLSARDPQVKAVYFYSEPLVQWDDQPADRPNLLPGFHVVVWTEAKHPALSKLGEALTLALEKESRRLPCSKATDLCHWINIAQVDDLDVEKKSGYGALLAGHERRSVEIWHRETSMA